MAVTTLSRATPSGDTDSANRRHQMIDSQLRPSDVTDPVVLAAIAKIDREAFVPAERAAMAYADRAIPLVDGRALNPVHTTARLIVDLALEPGAKVLLIGAATGYAAAVLAAMDVLVTAVEDHPLLAEMSRAALVETPGVSIVQGSMVDGAAAGAPFDALMFDGHVALIPAALLSQLRDGARIVGGLAEGAVTRIGRAIRVESADTVALLPFADMECVPLPGFALPARFQF